MYVIVGLGNPGKKYEKTRHNMGFIAVDRLAEKYGIKIEKNKFKSLVGEGNIAGKKVIIVKPQTYMNNSGEAVREVINFYKPDLSELIVIYDDIDIAEGVIRMRKFGSAGTHNGMRSVVLHTGSDRFPRIRIGIGAANKGDLIDHVIGTLRKDEASLLEESVEAAVSATVCFIESGIDIAMNRYNKANKKIAESEKDEKEKD